MKHHSRVESSKKGEAGKHVSESLKGDAKNKIEAKLQLLDSYISTGDADFSLPKKFSMNFFADELGHEKGIGSVSKSSKTFKDADVKEKVEYSLRCAQEMLACSQGKVKKVDEVKVLKEKVKEKEALIEKLTNQLVEQRLRADGAEKKTKVLEARIDSMNQNTNVEPIRGGRR